MKAIRAHIPASFNGGFITIVFLFFGDRIVNLAGDKFVESGVAPLTLSISFVVYYMLSYAIGGYIAASSLRGGEIFRGIMAGSLAFVAHDIITIAIRAINDTVLFLALMLSAALLGGVIAKLVRSDFVFQRPALAIPIGLTIMTLAAIVGPGGFVVVTLLITDFFGASLYERSPWIIQQHPLMIPLLFFAALIGLRIAGGLFWHGKRFVVATNAETARRRDPRKPILYLRSFSDDYTAFEPKGEKPESILAPFFGAPATVEEALVKALAYYGPVVAISEPDEFMPPPGAARMTLSNDTWPVEVESLMKEAQKVVLLVGSTRGVTWEFQKLIELDFSNKVILVFPDSDRATTWAEFRTKAGNVETLKLPEEIEDDTTLAVFDQNWVCRLISGTPGDRKKHYVEVFTALFEHP